MSRKFSVSLGTALVLFIVATPFVYYRWNYAHSKRLRVVDPGKLYRAGQMNAAGLAAAVRRYGIRTVLNLQNESPDPDVPTDFVGSSTIKESQLCRELGVNYRYLEVDLLPPARAETESPKAIAEFLKIMDDPKNYPVLIHCRAGLHRTGVLCALYRMEYNGWSHHLAIREMLDNGFGRKACHCGNEYISQYLLNYQPRWLTGQAEKNGPSRIAQSGQDR